VLGQESPKDAVVEVAPETVDETLSQLLDAIDDGEFRFAVRARTAPVTAIRELAHPKAMSEHPRCEASLRPRLAQEASLEPPPG